MKTFLLTITLLFFYSSALAEGSHKYILKFTPSINSDDTPYTFEVIGDSCEDLKIKSYGGNLYPEKPYFVGKAKCFPEVDNLKLYLENGEVNYARWFHIDLKDGPRISAVGPSETNETSRKDRKQATSDFVGRLVDTYKEEIDLSKASYIDNHGSPVFAKVESIKECKLASDYPLQPEFCASISIYEGYPSYLKEFQIFCNDCETLKASPEELQMRILADYSFDGLVLEGGYAFPLGMNPSSFAASDYYKLYQSLKGAK